MNHANRLFARLLLILTSSLTAACTQHPQAEFDLAIVGATLIDGTDNAPQPNQLILIRNGTIVEITDADSHQSPIASSIIDATGLFIMPGLADMHVHFGSGGFEPRGENATERAVDQFLHYGVTTVFNVGGTGGSLTQVQTLRNRQRSGEIPKLRVFATGNMLTLPGSHPVATIMRPPKGANPATYDWTNRGVAVVSSIDEARAATARNLVGGMDAIKIIVESGPSEFGEFPQMPPEMIAAIVDEAAIHGSFVVAHISSLDELEACINAGVHAVMHAVGEPPFPDAGHWAAMKDRHIYYVPTLSLYGSLFSTLWNDPAATADPFLTQGVNAATLSSTRDFDSGPDFTGPAHIEWLQVMQSVKDAHDAGVPIVLGTDTNNPRVYPGYSVHRELEILVELGMSPHDAIVAATRRPAEFFGHERERGTAEVGKSADLLLLSGNPLTDIRNTRTLIAVILDGQIINRDGP